jgi:chromate transporter
VSTPSGQNQPRPLVELALVFLRLGLTAFGGPVAHIALMEQEFVRNRKWLTRNELMDLITATNLIPGPNSTELAIHLGLRRAGWPGLMVSGACFILPAAFITCLLAWAYVRFGKLPEIQGVLYGVKPVIIAVIGQALWRLGGAALKTRWLVLVSVASVVFCALGVNQMVVLFGAGLCMLLRSSSSFGEIRRWLVPLPLVGAGSMVPVLATAAGSGSFSLVSLFGVFLKVGAVLFGSGYVLIALLRADLVSRLGWLSEGQLIDAIAVGQITPGPIFSTATFIGYLLGGGPGAVVATVGIFVPAFLFVALSAPFVGRLRQSVRLGAFLDGANASALALMAVAGWRLAGSALPDSVAWMIFVAATLVLIRFRINSAWLVLAGAAFGVLAG